MIELSWTEHIITMKANLIMFDIFTESYFKIKVTCATGPNKTNFSSSEDSCLQPVQPYIR